MENLLTAILFGSYSQLIANLSLGRPRFQWIAREFVLKIPHGFRPELKKPPQDLSKEISKASPEFTGGLVSAQALPYRAISFHFK